MKLDIHPAVREWAERVLKNAGSPTDPVARAKAFMNAIPDDPNPVWHPDPTDSQFLPSLTTWYEGYLDQLRAEFIGFCDCPVPSDLVSHSPWDPFVCQTCRKLPKPVIPVGEIEGCK